MCGDFQMLAWKFNLTKVAVEWVCVSHSFHSLPYFCDQLHWAACLLEKIKYTGLGELEILNCLWVWTVNTPKLHKKAAHFSAMCKARTWNDEIG